MRIDPNNTGMPALSVGEMTDTLTSLYAGAALSGIDFHQVPAVFLWGPPGIGKSQSVLQCAKLLREKTGKRVDVTDVRLLLFSPVDLRGIPVADPEKQAAIWLKPKIFDMDPSENVINILFLDELSAASQSMQAAAYQICLDRKIGEHYLPENCLVIAAGNRTTDRSVAYQMPKALCSRMMHFLIESDLDSWKEWAVKKGIDARIAGFLSRQPERLSMEPGLGDTAYCSPRTWEFVSTVLSINNKPPKEILPQIAACIGMDAAMEFVRYCEIYDLLPDLADIFAGTCSKYPKKADLLYALCSAVVYEVLRKEESISKAQLENVCAYCAKFPPDYAAMVFGELQAREALKMKLLNSAAYTRWLKAYGQHKK